MKKQIISLIGITFFLFSCGKDVSVDSSTLSGTTKTQETGWELAQVGEQVDMKSQPWYAEKIKKRTTDLEAFFTQLEKLSSDQKKKLNCGEYYPTDTEYFLSLYEEEQELIRTYKEKCDNLTKE